MEEAIVKVENLSHRYSVQWAIQGISFDVQKNGIQGLLGSNGAGKSTLMNIMCGVLRQTDEHEEQSRGSETVYWFFTPASASTN